MFFKYEMYFSLYGYILKSYNLKGIYSIILKFVEMIANETVSGYLLILKTFTLTAIPVRLLWVSLCRFTKHCITFHWNRIYKNPDTGFPPGKNRIIEKQKSL